MNDWLPQNSKLLEKLPMSDTFRIDACTIQMVQEPDDFIQNLIKVRIEKMVVAEKLAEDIYHATANYDTPKTTWDMFKHVHGDSWWLRWLAQRRPARYIHNHQYVGVKVHRYHAYPDATIEFPNLGKPVRYEVMEQTYER